MATALEARSTQVHFKTDFLKKERTPLRERMRNGAITVVDFLNDKTKHVKDATQRKKIIIAASALAPVLFATGCSAANSTSSEPTAAGTSISASASPTESQSISPLPHTSSNESLPTSREFGNYTSVTLNQLQETWKEITEESEQIGVEIPSDQIKIYTNDTVNFNNGQSKGDIGAVEFDDKKTLLPVYLPMDNPIEIDFRNIVSEKGKGESLLLIGNLLPIYTPDVFDVLKQAGIAGTHPMVPSIFVLTGAVPVPTH